MKTFINSILKFILVGLIPILLLLVAYFYLDPFKVVRDYDDYSYMKVIPNRDYMSTEQFLNNHQKYHYNSFIFGSSRVAAYRPSSWRNYLDKKASPFSFDAFSETLYGIHGKFKLLDSLNVKIDHCIIEICEDNTFALDGNSMGHIFIKHPAISHEPKWAFYSEFVKAYFYPKFLVSYYINLITNQYYNFMEEYLENRDILYDKITNETYLKGPEDMLKSNPKKYYQSVETYFYPRQKKEKINDKTRINKIHLGQLKEIKQILEKNNTNYKVIISPLYNQTKLNPGDMKILKEIFNGCIYDFSGTNQFTDSKYNYYESSHFRPIVGDSIFKIIYKKN